MVITTIIIFLLLKTQNFIFSKRQFLSKGFERSVYWKKQKVTIKIQQTNLDFCLNQILLESKFVFMQIKMLLLKNLKLRGITNQKDLLIIIMLPSMEKAFMINQLVLI